VATALWGAEALAAGIVPHSMRPLASNLIVPQRRVFSVERQPVQITEVSVGVVILEQAATTTMDIGVYNPAGSRQEAELLVAVPDGAVVRGFTFEGKGAEPSAQLLPKDEANRTYNEIVSKLRDPALLEFVGYNLIRSSVFPVEARGNQKVRLTFESLLTADGNRIDYVLPRSESVEYRIPWKVAAKVTAKQPISTVYSPSHKLETKRAEKNVMLAEVAAEARTEPGAFRLSCLLEQNGVTASLFAYPDPKVGGGYFLLLAGLPAKPPERKDGPAIKREVTLVFDRSGSMNGEKIGQVREAANQILAGLEEGEAFNLMVYNEQVDFFSQKPVAKSKETVQKAREYLATINARGGTNIHDALLEALRPKPTDGVLPMVLFLTDGLPTVGQTSEVAIREVAMKANPHNRRIFTFGVGFDVNTPLLDKIASETRATSTYVLPKEDVEVRVASVFKRLAGPVLAGPTLELIGPDGKPAPGRARDVMPTRLPDLFEGDQLVILGQYLGEEPLDFKVTGNYLGKDRTFRFKLGVDKATTKNAFVPRLWANRKIAFLFDAIRQLGASAPPATVRDNPPADPKVKELVVEIVRLSTEFGILTEYTAFLAREGTDLSRHDQVLNEAHRNYTQRAIGTRSGRGAVNQNFNYVRQVGADNAPQLRFRNDFYDENMDRVSITAVQQVNDWAFYNRNGRWVDSRVVEQENTLQPKRVIEFGSEEFRKLALALAGQGRQGAISLNGDILLVVDGQPILVRGPAAAGAKVAAEAEQRPTSK
jgi:Ca-activated chloride channel family protein